MFQLRTFGGLALHQDGAPLDQANAQRKVLALLTVLAAAGAAGMGREKVMLLLWPESDTGRARGALKQMLHILRRQLGSPDAILGTTELRLNPQYVESDVAGFRAALGAGDLEGAVSLYDGAFLDGVHVDGAPEFHAWAEQQRAELEGRFREGLDRLARSAEARGDVDRAIAWWRRLQAADPLNGRVALCLMEALEASGDRAAALRHARIHETLLREEWGLEPDPAVAALAARLRDPADPPPRVMITASMRAGEEGQKVQEVQENAEAEELTPARASAEPNREVTDRSTGVPRHPRLSGLASLALAATFAIGGSLAAGVAVRGMTRAGSSGGPPAPLALADSAPNRVLEQGSIAVLPFIDLSPERDQEYFSDGITEELITHLSKVTGLKVPARTSSFQFKGTRTDVREVGARLGVVHVLEGSVRKAGDRLRITVQLINVEDGYHVWAETYDRGTSDVLAVQEEISRAVADALRLHLVGGEGRADFPRHTSSFEAYELFLRGRFFANQRSESALARAAEYFQQAIAIDPRFARAYVGLADTYIAPRHGAPAERFLRASRLVTTALALDSTLAEAHTSMGWIRMWYDRDWAAAERHLQRAMALDPSYLWAQQWYGAYLGAVGRLDQSLVASQRAQQLDPLSVAANTHVGTHLFFLGRYEEAIHQYGKALELDPNFFMARWGLSRVYLQLGRHEEAMRELQYPGTDYLGFFRPALLGYAHGVTGQEAEARLVLAELRERREQGEYVAPTEFAAIHLGLGERAAALDWLEQHEADRGARIFLQVDPIFASLRSEARFQLLLRRLRLE
jgi:TolB-like protein/DNA-binding SARP family transcriptional activator/Tfp pilus assembly protein PilF